MSATSGLNVVRQAPLRVLQVLSVEALGEPGVAGSEQVAGVDTLTRLRPEASMAGRKHAAPRANLLITK